MISACQVFHPDLGAATLLLLTNTLQPPFTPPSQDMLLTPLLNDLSQLPQRGILVLEDYHLINEPQIHQAMMFLLDHVPATLHIVMLTRNETPLPLARLRASGDVGDITSADLRFSAEETRQFLQQSSAAPLASESIAQVDAQLEGWPAGLRLLTLALHGRQSPDEIARKLATFAGSHQPVLDYFVAEVLQAQPAYVQDFLLRTAMLERLTGALCDAVLKNEAEPAAEMRASALVLGALARANLFLEPLDGAGAWYRYHTLFADAMRYEARRRLGADALGAVAARASVWYEQHDMLSEAIEAALRARTPERAANLIEQLLTNKQVVVAFQTFTEAQETHTLQRWIGYLPQAILSQHPLLCINYAIVLLMGLMEGRAADTRALIDQHVQMAEVGFRADDNQIGLGQVFAFRAMLTKQDGAIDDSMNWARQALAVLPTDVPQSWRAASLSALGTGEEFAGRLTNAHRVLLEARALTESLGNWSFSRAILNMLSRVYAEQGELHRAAELFRQTLAEARAQGDRDDIGHAQLALMRFSYQWNDLDAAEQQAREALAVGVELADQEFMAHARMMLAWLAHIGGETAAAQQQIQSFLAQVQPPHSLRRRWHVRAALALQAQLALAAGDLLTAQRWADTYAQDDSPLPALQRAREQLLIARVLLAHHQHAATLQLLAECLAAAEQHGHTRFALEAQLLLALAHAAGRQPQEARQALFAALTGAMGEGYVRLFLDAGAAGAALLRANRAAIREPALAAYADTLLHAFATPAQPSAVLAEALSPQEQRVLQLLAAGCTNAEIAAQLIVSVNTVKAHLKNIYRKLNVSTRVQASAAFHKTNDE